MHRVRCFNYNRHPGTRPVGGQEVKIEIVRQVTEFKLIDKIFDEFFYKMTNSLLWISQSAIGNLMLV